MKLTSKFKSRGLEFAAQGWGNKTLLRATGVELSLERYETHSAAIYAACLASSASCSR